MAFDPRALGAQAFADNRAYKARSGGYSPFAPAQPQQTLATNQVQPRQTPANMTPPNYTPQMAPAGYTPGQGGGGLPPKNLLVGAGGVPMGTPVFGQANPNAPNYTRYNMGGPNAQAGITVPGDILGLKAKQALAQTGISPNQNMTGPNALPTQPYPNSPWAQAQAAYRANQAPANPVVTPTTQPSFTGGGDWARNFFGSGMGGQYGTGNAMAKLQGWAQNNPEAVQRMRNTGLVPPADYYTRNR